MNIIASVLMFTIMAFLILVYNSARIPEMAVVVVLMAAAWAAASLFGLYYTIVLKKPAPSPKAGIAAKAGFRIPKMPDWAQDGMWVMLAVMALLSGLWYVTFLMLFQMQPVLRRVAAALMPLRKEDD